jgi:acyl carrier protein
MSCVAAVMDPAMPEAEALEVLRGLLQTIAGADPNKVQHESRFVEDLQVDSLGMMEMLVEVEEAFKVRIDAGELPRILTVADLLKLLRNEQIIA